MATTTVMNEEKKTSSIMGFFRLIKILFLLVFPIFKALQFNKYLSLIAKINKDKGGILNFIKESFLFVVNTKIRGKNNDHFDDVIANVSLYTKQKILNLILGFMFSMPLIISLIIANSTIKKDTYFMNRVDTVSSSKISILEKGKAYFYTISVSIKDNEREQDRKYYTKIILTRISLMIGLGLILQLIGGYTFVYSHPQEEKNQMLRNLLVSNGVRRKEDDSNMVAFFTPMGVLVDITGSMPTDIVHNDRIWSSLNIKINKKDWLNDPSKRSLVFFKTDYELKPSYMYENIK